MNLARSTHRALLALSSVVLISTGCATTEPAPPPLQEAAPPPMPTKDEMMAMWQNFATPGVEHKVLDVLVGEWDHTVQWWMDPKAPPETSKGKSSIRWIMGGRYLEHKVTGKAMGQPFEGRGFIGYDRATQKYRSIWFDNMGTGLMVGEGLYDVAARKLSESGTSSCPMTGTMPYRGVTTFLSPTAFQYEMFMTPPGGNQEMKAMQIDYKRRGRVASKK